MVSMLAIFIWTYLDRVAERTGESPPYVLHGMRHPVVIQVNKLFLLCKSLERGVQHRA